MIAADGHIKLVDFGFSKVLEENQRTFTLCGTPEYLAPEILMYQGHDQRVDWWALGILLYEMLVGSPPFYHEDPMLIYNQILTGYYELPEELEINSQDLISSLLNPDPSKRIGDGLQVLLFLLVLLSFRTT